MKKFANKLRCELAETTTKSPNPVMKFVSFMVFEEEGKTILQPIAANQEAEKIQELFQNNTLEVWLSNGQSLPEQFDVAILKYKQQLQPSKMCNKTANRVCLKNHFETIVSCEQCPLSDEGAED